MSWKRDGETVTISLTVADWELLLMRLGYVAGVFKRDGRDHAFRETLALTNRICEGNPNYDPYELPEIRMAEQTMSEAKVFTGSLKRDWEAIQKQIQLHGLPALDEFDCPVCHERMMMDAEVHAHAGRTPGAIIACLRCVCKAKEIPYPESCEVQ